MGTPPPRKSKDPNGPCSGKNTSQKVGGKKSNELGTTLIWDVKCVTYSPQHSAPPPSRCAPGTYRNPLVWNPNSGTHPSRPRAGQGQGAPMQRETCGAVNHSSALIRQGHERSREMGGKRMTFNWDLPPLPFVVVRTEGAVPIWSQPTLGLFVVGVPWQWKG